MNKGLANVRFRKVNSVADALTMYSVDPSTGCWIWSGSVNGQGYGRISIGGRRYQAHRIFMEASGADLRGLVADHKCRNRLCVNPKHLRAVTVGENGKENSISPWGKNAAKTHCIRGHELSGNNLHVDSDGYRRCRTCRAERWRSRKKRLRALANGRAREKEI